MDFDLEKDLEIFKTFFEKRPEVTREGLKSDLQKYYLPYVKKLIDLKEKKNSPDGMVVGVSAIQGAGKTTQGEIMQLLLDHFNHPSVSISIDDHYITHRELCELREEDPRFIRRGVTHDITLAMHDLENLKSMEENIPILVSGYDKGAHKGDGDRFRWIIPDQNAVVKFTIEDRSLTINKSVQTVRALVLQSVKYNEVPVWLPPNMGSDLPLVEHFLPDELLGFLQSQSGELELKSLGEFCEFSGQGKISVPGKNLPKGWKIVSNKPDFIFYDGWMLSARNISDETIFDQDLPALDTPEHKEFAKYVNKKLLNYEKLWGMIEFLNLLYVKDYQNSLKWRDQAEEALRQKGEGMSSDEIREFVYYFWRSVHPAIHIKALSEDKEHTNQVVVINDDHSVGEVIELV
jgi:pantothenate kinase-related protein Tda10